MSAPTSTSGSARLPWVVLGLALLVLVAAGAGLLRPRLEIGEVQRLASARTDQASFEIGVEATHPSAVLRVEPRPCTAGITLDGQPLVGPPAHPRDCHMGAGVGLPLGTLVEPGPHSLGVTAVSDGVQAPSLELREQPGGLGHVALMIAATLGLAGVLVSLQQLLAAQGRRRWAAWAAVAGLLGAMGVYLLAAPPGPFHFPEVSTPYHRILAEALLQGRVSLEPGDAIYDLCQHDGRLYLCWGAMPAVLLVPVAWLWEGGPTGTLAGTAVGLITMAAWAGVFWTLRRRGTLEVGWLDLVLLVAFSVFGTQLWFLSASGEVWHLGQSFAVMLGSLAVLCLLPRRLATGVLATALFGMAALSRFSLMLLFPVFGLMALLLHLEGVRRWRDALLRGGLLALPLFGALGAQLLYNRARYGALLDFGWSKQLGSDHLIDDLVAHGTLSLSYLPRNLRSYLLDPLDVSATWPFFEYSGHGNAVWSYQLGLFVLLFAALATLPALPGSLWRLRSWLRELRTAGPEALTGLRLAPVLLWGSAVAYGAYWIFLLLLFTTGWRTAGCRLLANAQPFFLVLLAFAFARLRGGFMARYALWALLLLSILAQTWIKGMMA